MPLDPAEIVSIGKSLTVPASLAGTLSDAWHAVIGDRVAAWRLKNAARLQTLVSAELDRCGLKIRSSSIPERYAIAWFDEATKQDEEAIQKIFAKLLAKAAIGSEDGLRLHLLEIVGRMTGQDAKVFDYLIRYEDGKLADLERHEFDEDQIVDAMKRDLGDYNIASLERLISLGLIDHKTSIDLENLREYINNIKDLNFDIEISVSIDSSDLIMQTFYFTESAIALASCIHDDMPNARK